MLRSSWRWRAQWQVDTALESWTPPEVVRLYYPHGISGVDKEGAPVCIVTFAGLDLVGLLHSATRQDLIRTTIQILERVATPPGLCVVCDMEGFSLRQYAWRPAAQYVVALLQMYEANYPEILRACFVINAPRVFAIAFNVIKSFLDERTLAKIQIFKREPNKWQAALLANISPTQLPKQYGGDLQDPDGNPRYTTKINVGGQVPKSFYTKQLQGAEPGGERACAVIKKGGKLVLDFTVTEENCFLRWDFRTEEHDIRFGITLRDAAGQTSAAVRFARVASHQIDENGVLACQAPATYTVTFDNGYSLMRSKRLHYRVYVTEPLKKIQILPGEEEEEEEKEEETVEGGAGAV